MKIKTKDEIVGGVAAQTEFESMTNWYDLGFGLRSHDLVLTANVSAHHSLWIVSEE